MSEPWIRALMVAIGVLAALAVVYLLRRRTGGALATGSGGLGPGLYLFTSETCVDCMTARARLLEDLGRDGFVEIRWEDRPELFAAMGIDVVPCTVVVSAEGDAVRYPGPPDRALDRLGP